MLVLVPRELAQLPAQLPQPIHDAGGDGRLRAGAVVLELLDDDGRDQQLQLAPVHEYPQRHDPLLAITAGGQVKPGGGVDQQPQHEEMLRNSTGDQHVIE
jgi:hypothetical protein